MRNYGEELGYWYLRLNGFFPISDFVVHRDRDHDDEEFHSDRDCDLLGVRPPKVYEILGGQEGDWDTTLTESFDFNKTLGVIGEVKTGDVRNILTRHLLVTAVQRLGFVDSNEADTVVDDLAQNGIWEDDNYQIFTLLISHSNRQGSWKNISLPHVVMFLKNRFITYEEHKFSARTLFDSSLIQMLADYRFER